MNLPLLHGRLREQMQLFLGKLSDLPKPARRFCLEALYGICVRKSVRLSEIARALGERIRLIKTENRLSRQAARKDLAQTLTRYVIEQSAHRIGDRTLLVIDPSDLAKKYGRKMEHLAQVRDGSEGGIVNGYWLCQVLAVECGGHELTPLVNHLWSSAAPGHLSENDEVLACVRSVTDVVGSKGIWVMDRGGDRMSIMEVLLKEQRRFLIRLVGNRHLRLGNVKMRADDLAKRMRLPYIDHVVKQRPDGTERRLELSYGMRRVTLPAFPDAPLTLVALHGFGEKPLMILTNEPLTNSRKSLWWAIEAYLTRWRIEDTLRFAKQTYQLEDVRVLGYQSLKNVMALVLLAMSFTMLWLGQREKLAILAHHALVAAKRLFGIPDFRYYALSDGLAEILSKRTAPAFPKSNPWDLADQPDLFSYAFP